MSDYGTGDAGKKRYSFLEKPFFTLAKPYLDLLAKGSLFNLLYFVMAGVNVILPFAVFATAVNMGIFRYEGNFAIAFIFAWVIILFACWIGMQLWLERRKKIASLRSTEFIAIVIFSDMVQTFGEWLGTLSAITGAGAGIIALIILGDNAASIFRMIGLGFTGGSGAMIILAGPAAGFVIIITFRFTAELMRALIALVNNTHDIAANIKKSAPAGGQRPVLPAGPKGRSL